MSTNNVKRYYWSEETNKVTTKITRHGWHREMVLASDYDALKRCYDGILDAGNKALAERDALAASHRELVDLLQEIDQGLWQNFVSVRKRPTLADITAIWGLSQKWRAALTRAKAVGGEK